MKELQKERNRQTDRENRKLGIGVEQVTTFKERERKLINNRKQERYEKDWG